MTPGPGRSGAPFPMKTVLSSSSLKPQKLFSNRSITPIIEEFRAAQQTGLNTWDAKTDVILALDDGNIPCHGAILSAVSPFFAKMFESQGNNFTDKVPREITMPDFPLRIMKKVIQLIYNDEAAISSQKEHGKIRETMRILEIFKDDLSLVLNCEKGKITDKNEIIYMEDTSNSKKIEDSDAEVEDEDTNVREEIASPQKTPQKPPQKSPAKKSGGEKSRKTGGQEADKKKKKSDADFKPHDSSSSEFSLSSSESDDDDNNSSSRKRKTRQRGRPSNVQSNNVKVVVEKLAASSSSSKAATSSTTTGPATTTNSKPATASVPRPVMRTNNSFDSATTEQLESELSSSDREWDDSKCEDRKWFLSESSKCQKCKTQYSTAAKASECIAKHKVLRCYYCFHLCRTTDKLFEHFKKAHKQAGREDFLMCPFCEQSVPYKSVSCHVISLHMGPQDPKKLPTSRYVKPAASTSVKPEDSKMNPPPAKKPKIEEKEVEKEPSEYRVGNLEATISWTKENGKKRIFILKRNRGYPD